VKRPLYLVLGGLLGLAGCTGCSNGLDPAAPDPAGPEAFPQSEASAGGELDEAPAEPPPEPPPPPPPPPLNTFSQGWTTKLNFKGFSGDRLGVAVAPWGDSVVLTEKTLTVYDRASGELLASTPLAGWTCLPGALAFQDDGSLVLVSSEGIERLRFPARSWERLVELGGVDDARIRGPHVVVRRGATLQVYALPATEPLATLELPAEPTAYDVAPDGAAVAASFAERGLVLYTLPAGEAHELSDAPKIERLGFGRGRLLVGVDKDRLVPWSLETLEPNPLAYEAGWTVKGTVRELSDGRVLVGKTIFPAQPMPPEPRWAKGTRGQALTSGGLTKFVSLRPDGRAVVILSHFELICLSEAGPDPARPFEVRELGGLPPPPPGRTAQRPDPGERERLRAEARDAFFDGHEPPEWSFSAWNNSFLAPDERSEAVDAFFVRLSWAAVGGEFDLFGDEEVSFRLSTGSTTRTLHWVVLDLSDRALSDYVADDAGWLELPPKAQLELELEVYDVDVTGLEHITGLVEPYALDTGRLTPEVQSVELPLKPISARLDGAGLELEFLRAPRRDAKDADSVAAVRSALGALLPLEPTDRAAARALAEALPAAIEGALERAGTSTHTHTRRALPQLAELAYALQPLAARYGAADAVPLREALDACNAWIAEHTILDPELQASCEALAAFELQAPLTLEQLDALVDAALRIEPDNELAQRQPLGAFHQPLEALLKAAKAARPGLEADLEPRVRAAWAPFAERLAAELEPPD